MERELRETERRARGAAWGNAVRQRQEEISRAKHEAEDARRNGVRANHQVRVCGLEIGLGWIGLGLIGRLAASGAFQ